MAWGSSARAAIVVGLTSTALAALAAGPAIAAQSRSPVGSGTPLPSGARVIGPLPDGDHLALTVSLDPLDPAALQRLATAASTPGNPDHGHFISVTQFAARFGAPTSHISAVERTLLADGLTVGHLDRNDLTLDVSGRAGAVDRAFDVSEVAVRDGNQRGYANRSAPTLPASVARYVQNVSGLEDVDVDLPAGQFTATGSPNAGGVQPSRAPRISTGGGPQPCAAAVDAAARGGLTSDELATAYQFPLLYAAGDFGQGQTVGVLAGEPFDPNAIATFAACYGLSSRVNTIPVPGYNGGPPNPNREEWETEAELDIQTVQGLAPQASINVYLGNAAADSTGVWSAAISADTAKVLSASFGRCERLRSPASTAEGTLFEEAAVQGQTVLASSGDNGASACSVANLADTSPAVSFPASQPFVTGVGGTTLFSDIGAPFLSYWRPGMPLFQGVWSSPARPQPGNQNGSGGGISNYAMPGYQSSAAPAVGVINGLSSGAPCGGGGSFLCREVPDVSANAGDFGSNWVVFLSPSGIWPTGWSASGGGTSGSTPLWAAWIALANALPACRGIPIGFANPSLYDIASVDYAGNFTDIVSPSPAFPRLGHTDIFGVNGGLYPVTPGYDMATGLGSMTAQLAASLCNRRFTVSFPGLGAQNVTLGRPVHLAVRAVDSGGQPLTYSASGLPAGLSISPAGVITGTPTRVGTATSTIRAIDRLGNVGSGTITWTVLRTSSIRLTEQPRLGGVVGQRVSRRVRATSVAGLRIGYSATGLPAGLRMTSAGQVRGRLRRRGSGVARITVTAMGGNRARFTSSWRVLPTVAIQHARRAPAIRVTTASLTGVLRLRPRLVVSLAAAKLKLGIRAVTLRLGTTPLLYRAAANRLRAGIRLTAAARPSGRLAAIAPRAFQLTARTRARSLTVRLRRAFGRLRITVRGPAVTAPRVLVAAVRRRPFPAGAGTLRLVAVNTRRARSAASIRFHAVR